MTRTDFEAPLRGSTYSANQNYSYECSSASSVSSSSSSIFSQDDRSSQSSAPSSSKSFLNVPWDSEPPAAYANELLKVQPCEPEAPQGSIQALLQNAPTCTNKADYQVSQELRQHPRRTQPITQVSSDGGAPSATCVRPPPPLVRQCDRKDNFVESLVDTTTQMIEVIWPLSVMPCNRDTVLGGKNVIGLRTFIQEVLKRSKTSYSTLQVALYYLILVKPYIPSCDFTTEQSEDSYASRAMQCGRRMFLTALILASKYLQDRNYSARAWSKISGLKVCEINTNEMAFVTAVNWKLHVPESTFQKWTDVVLKYSSGSCSSPSRRNSEPKLSWKCVVPRLTPELDFVESFDSPKEQSSPLNSDTCAAVDCKEDCGLGCRTSFSLPIRELPIFPGCQKVTSPIPRSAEQTPTSKTSILSSWQVAPERALGSGRTLPPLPTPNYTPLRMASLTPCQLPANTFAPQPTNFATPAASASSLCPLSRKNSMCFAMRKAQTSLLSRSVVDQWRVATPSQDGYPSTIRRSSLANTSSVLSSPESMVSDTTSRSSRSSSISSISSSTSALAQLPQQRLAVQATCRRANQQLENIKEASRAFGVVHETSPMRYTEYTSDEYVSSPEQYASHGLYHKVSQVRLERPVLATPSWNPAPVAAAPLSACRLDRSDREAAEGLRDLALSRQPVVAGRKRERPGSLDVSATVLQNAGDVVTPRSLDDVRIGEDDGSVLADPKLATSFLLAKGMRLPSIFDVEVNGGCVPGRGGKRQCFAAAENRGLRIGPGMWSGVL